MYIEINEKGVPFFLNFQELLADPLQPCGPLQPYRPTIPYMRPPTTLQTV